MLAREGGSFFAWRMNGFHVIEELIRWKSIRERYLSQGFDIFSFCSVSIIGLAKRCFSDCTIHTGLFSLLSACFTLKGVLFWRFLDR